MACRREGISPFVLAQPGRPASSGSVMLHDHGFGSRGAVVMCRTRPITRPSKIATPSVPGLLSGKVRRQTMLEAFICSASTRVNRPQAQLAGDGPAYPGEP